MNTHHLPSAQIPVRDFRTVLLWPLRLEPTGSLKTEYREDNQKCASDWISEYATFLTAGDSKWKKLDDYYIEHEPHDGKRYAEFVYFHPFIHRCLFDPQSPVSVLTRTDITHANITLRDGDVTWQCAVEGIHLYLFPADVAILTVRLGSPRTATPGRDFRLSDAMDFLDRVRRIYPPYYTVDETSGKLSPGAVVNHFGWITNGGSGARSDFDCVEGYQGTVRAHRRPPVARHWQALLEPLVPHPLEGRRSLAYSQLEDDRIPVLSYIAVDDPRAIYDQDWVRLAVCDAYDTSTKWPYSKTFLNTFEQDHCYDRFWMGREAAQGVDAEHLTTRYLVTGYSFVAVGRKGDRFFDNVIPDHVLRIYALLALLAHLQKAALLGFWQRLATMIHEFECKPPSDESKKQLLAYQDWLFQDLTDFTGRFYFREVSNQVQAIELFEMMTRHLRVRQFYEDVVRQSEFVKTVVYDEWRRRQEAQQQAIADEQASISRLAHRALPVGVAASVLGLSFGLPQLDELMKRLMEELKWSASQRIWSSVAMSLVILALFWGLGYLLVNGRKGRVKK